MRATFHLAVIGVSIAGAVFWIEHMHQVDIGAVAGPANAVSPAAVCPENENVPYSADCIMFMQGESRPERDQMEPKKSTPAAFDGSGSLGMSDPACPANNENAPYSANCIRFMSGWYWRPDHIAGRP